jgi:hypothetical protein
MNTKNQITENNILLAQFLGYQNKPDISNDLYINSDKKDVLFINQMKFDSDYKILMQVVEKIESIGVITIIKRMTTEIIYVHPIKSNINYNNAIACGVKINHIYASCIDFVKWYNDQKF